MMQFLRKWRWPLGFVVVGVAVALVVTALVRSNDSNGSSAFRDAQIAEHNALMDLAEELSKTPVADPVTVPVGKYRTVHSVSRDATLDKVLCTIDYGGTVKEVGRLHDRVLGVYFASEAKNTSGRCVSGTYFFLPLSEFNDLPAEHEAAKAEFKALDELVAQAISRPLNTLPFTTNSLRAVDTVNRDGSFFSICLLPKGSQIAEEARSDDTVILRVINSGNHEGTSCVTGDLLKVTGPELTVLNR